MPAINTDKLTKEYGGTTLFRNLSFSIDHGDRIGLVGRNGCGKSSLLNILVGTDEPSSGTTSLSKGMRLGYLPQKPPDLDSRTLWMFMEEVFSDLKEMESRLNSLATELSESSENDAVHQSYSELQEEFERLEGYAYENRIHKVLSGLGFSSSQHNMPLEQFSGGWRTRAYLARLLLEEPDILLLDEPTNHLDLSTVRWLERFLASWKKGLLIVSHDRFFLNSLCNRIWEMVDDGIEYYRGDYQQYRRQREARLEERLKRWESQQKYIDETQDFIRRNIAGQRTKEAQGRRKHLERFLREDAISKPLQEKSIHINFSDIERTGQKVLSSGKMAVGYGQDVVAEIPRVELLYQKRLGIIGPNGCGKSTIIKTWLKEIQPITGSFAYGSGVKPGYLSQTLTELNPELNLVDSIRKMQKNPDDASARKLLGSLLFSGDDVFKRVGDLSGGERSRLAIARLALQGANLLFLDEPTNHLDIAAQEVLQRILQEYPGTLVFISHDRYLVQALATELIVFEDGNISYFDGTLADYQNYKDARQEGGQAVSVPQAVDSDKELRKQDYASEKRKKNELRRQQKRFTAVEKEIHQLEEKKVSLEDDIGNASQAMDMKKLNELTDELKAVDTALETLFEEWEELGSILE